MNTRTLSIVVLVVAIAGLAYWFGASRSQDAAMSQDQASGTQLAGSNTGEYDAVDPAMLGTWKSKDDAKFTREFRADATVVDRYEGDASATDTGTYVTVDPTVIDTGVPEASLAGMTVLKITFEKSGVMFFGINSMTESDLTMTYLGGAGKPLMFSKVN